LKILLKDFIFFKDIICELNLKKKKNFFFLSQEVRSSLRDLDLSLDGKILLSPQLERASR
jgi:hypothetical protein